MSPPEHGNAVIVTVTDIYDDVQATKKQVSEISYKLDRFISVNERLDSHKRDIGEHDDRIRKLEIQIGAQWVIVGIVTAGVTAMVVNVFSGGN